MFKQRIVIIVFSQKLQKFHPRPVSVTRLWYKFIERLVMDVGLVCNPFSNIVLLYTVQLSFTAALNCSFVIGIC